MARGGCANRIPANDVHQNNVTQMVTPSNPELLGVRSRRSKRQLLLRARKKTTMRVITSRHPATPTFWRCVINSKARELAARPR
jgi:hypothetical protein